MKNTAQTDTERAFIEKARTVQIHRSGVARGEDIWDLSTSTLRTHGRRSGGNTRKGEDA